MKRFFFFGSVFFALLVFASWAQEEEDRGRKWGQPGKKKEDLHILWPVYSKHKCPSLFTFALSLPPPLPLSFSVLLSHWDGSHVLWRPSEMKPQIGALAGGRRRRRLQKKLGWRYSQDTSQQPNWMW